MLQIGLRPANDDQGESARVRVSKLIPAVLVPSALGASVREGGEGFVLAV